MEKVERTFNVNGKLRRAPDAVGGGSFGEGNRWRLLVGGITDCLYVCPRSNRVLRTYLQQAWAEAMLGMEAWEREHSKGMSEWSSDLPLE